LIVANLASSLSRPDMLRETLKQIGPQVERINLVLNGQHEAPSWLAKSGNVRVLTSPKDLGPAGVFFPDVAADDFVFLIAEDIIYPTDYARRMLAVFNDIALDRKAIGIRGFLYPDFFDGAESLIYADDESLAEHQLVNQLSSDSILCRGADLPPMGSMENAGTLAGLRFAIHCFRKGIPSICIARKKNWLKQMQGEHNAPFTEEFVREAQEISGLGRLPIRYLDAEGRIPRHHLATPEKLIANGDFSGLLESDDVLAPMQQIAPRWQIDYLGNPHESNLNLIQTGFMRGLRVDFSHAMRWIRLLTPVDLAVLNSRIVHATVSLRATNNASLRPQIDGIFLLIREQDARWIPLVQLSGAIFARTQSETHSVSVRLPAIPPQSEIYFCVQLSGPVEIDSVTLSEGSSKTTLGQIFVRRAKEAVPEIALLNSKSAIEAEQHKPRMAVVSWSLGHNPVGRAYNLAELASRDFQVDLVGTLMPRFGAKLWLPLRDAEIPIRGFTADNMKIYLAGISELARTMPCDVVYVSKPRFPGLLLGMLLSERNDCPLLLDVDDLELAFMKNPSPLSIDEAKGELREHSAQFDDPGGELWSRFADTLIAEADAITVSNAALADRYGGIVLRHARDEAKFFPHEAKRREVRAEFGFSDDQKVILFVGTPRQHKGLMRIAEALAQRNDPRLALCIIGLGGESAFGKELVESGFVRTFGPQSFARLPDIIRCGDAVCLLQDASAPISEFQIPAKLSEALAMGLPVLASRVAPLSELIASGAIVPVDTDEELQRALDDFLTGSLDTEALRDARRNLFLSEFSFAANIPRLREAYTGARRHHARGAYKRHAMLVQLADYIHSHMKDR
jgi:glycosyltransferase involved in cell wall biosynthesis